MPLSIENNIREPWSRITDTRILRPGDELRLVGSVATAVVALLDSHDPSAADPSIAQILGLTSPSLPEHHHILMQLEGQTEVLSSGLYVATGEAEELVFRHITHLQAVDPTYGPRLRTMHRALGTSMHGLYFISDQEQLSATPEAQPYLDSQGGLLR